MNALMQEMLAKDQQYNPGDLAATEFGFDSTKHYDLLVVAPGWKPTKILPVDFGTVSIIVEHSYISSYEVEWDNKRIAWIQIASGGCNLIDHLTVCAQMNFDRLVFLGAVGGLKRGFEVGDLYTPSFCIEGTMAPAYLLENPMDFHPFGIVHPANTTLIDQVLAQTEIPIKKASVFCTDSIFGEYYHLDFIKSFDTDLIEMETSTFYHLADMLEKPAIALLVVSDNSANGEPLLGKPELQKKRYNHGRKVLIPQLLKYICQLS